MAAAASKRTAGLWILLALVVGFFWFISHKGGVPQAPSMHIDAQQERQADLNNLAVLHRSLNELGSDLDEASKTYSDQVKRGGADRFALYQAAQESEQSLLQLQAAAEKVEAPEMSNSDAGKATAAALEQFKRAVLFRWSASHEVSSIADSGDMKPSELAEVQDNMNLSNEAIVSESVSILAAYQALGVKVEDIDQENGGVKKDKAPAKLKR